MASLLIKPARLFEKFLKFLIDRTRARLLKYIHSR
jgi:hypothetical protein